MCVASCARSDSELVRRLGPVLALGKHEKAVGVRIKGTGGRLRLGLDYHGAVGDLLGLRRDRLLLLWRSLLGLSGLSLNNVCLLSLGSRAHSSAMEIDGARRRPSTGKLGKEGLGVGTGRREHRPAAARSQARPQGRFVGRRKTAAQMMGITKVVIGRTRKYGRAQRASPQRNSTPVEWCYVRAGQEGRGGRQGGDRRQLGVSWCLWGAPEGLLEGIGLQTERSADRGREVVRSVGTLLLTGSRRRRKRFGGLGSGRDLWFHGRLGVCVDRGVYERLGASRTDGDDDIDGDRR